MKYISTFKGNHLSLIFLRSLFLILFFCLDFPFLLVRMEVFMEAGEKKN